MTPIDLAASVLAGVLLFGQFLLLLGLAGMVICTAIIFLIARDIWTTICIKKEKRGLH